MLLIATALAAPPSWSADLDHLDPPFRAKVGRVIEALEAQGYHPRPSCTFRSPNVQDLLFNFGGGATRARGGQSCHNHASDGEAASWAVDLWDNGMDFGLVAGWSSSMARQVPFLRALGEAAHAEGLVWGGKWRGHKSPWNEHGLGWDPAHVQDSRCR